MKKDRKIRRRRCKKKIQREGQGQGLGACPCFSEKDLQGKLYGCSFDEFGARLGNRGSSTYGIDKNQCLKDDMNTGRIKSKQAVACRELIKSRCTCAACPQGTKCSKSTSLGANLILCQRA